MADLWINDRDIADYGCLVTRLSGWWSAPARQLEQVNIPGRAGAWLVDTNARFGSRRLTVGVLLTPASMSARRTAAAALYAALRGVVELRINDDPLRFVYATLTASSAQSFGVALVESRLEVELEFEATDPFFYDVTPSVVGIPIGSTVRRAIATGTAPHGGVLRLAGAGTNPCTVTLRNRAGDTVQTMTLATTWTTAEYVEIDCDQWTVKKWSAGAATNILAYLGATETFLRFTPEDEPTLTITGCGGAALFYRKADLV